MTNQPDTTELTWADLFEEARSQGLTIEDVRNALDILKRKGDAEQ